MNRNFVLNGETVDATVQALFTEVQDQISNELYYSQMGFTEYEPDIPEEKLSSVSGFGKGTLTIAGQQYGANQRYKGYSKQISLRKYTSEIDFTEEDIHWLSKAPTTKRVMEFRENIEGAVNALNANINEDTAKLFYLAHGTTFYTGGDSVALASSAHPVRKSGTSNQSNIFASTHLAFSNTALVTAMERMDRFLLNDATQIRPTKNLLILHSIELDDLVDKTLYSMYGPDTANLGVNIGGKETLQRRGKRVSHFAVPDWSSSYSNYYAVIDLDRAKKMLFLAWGWKPRLRPQSELRKGTYYNEGSVLFSPEVRDWRFSHHSKGDGSGV